MSNVTFTIIGATGDLAKRYIFPAIYTLIKEKKVDQFAVIGLARRPMTAQQLLAPSKEFIANLDPQIWTKLEQSTYYNTLRFDNVKDFHTLKSTLQNIEQKHGLSGNRLFYLATLPQHFDTITQNLAASGVAKQSKTTNQ